MPIPRVVYLKIVTSLYGRNYILEVVQRTAGDVFVPTTVSGGLRSVGDVHEALRSGAGKVAINTACVVA
jgi:cyclase